MRIKDLPKQSRPREKALLNGINCLSNEELLAIIIGSGIHGNSALDIANNLLSRYDSVSSLSREEVDKLTNVDGLSSASALKLCASFMLAQRIIMEDALLINKINSTDDLYHRFAYYFKDKTQEMFILVWLNNINVIVHQKTLYIGTNNEVHVSSDEIIFELLKTNAHKFVIIHNHPNGIISPSDKDMLFSALLKNKSRKKGFVLVDHLIIANNNYFSFRDNKLL